MFLAGVNLGGNGAGELDVVRVRREMLAQTPGITRQQFSDTDSVLLGVSFKEFSFVLGQLHGHRFHGVTLKDGRGKNNFPVWAVFTLVKCEVDLPSPATRQAIFLTIPKRIMAAVRSASSVRRQFLLVHSNRLHSLHRKRGKVSYNYFLDADCADDLPRKSARNTKRLLSLTLSSTEEERELNLRCSCGSRISRLKFFARSAFFRGLSQINN